MQISSFHDVKIATNDFLRSIDQAEKDVIRLEHLLPGKIMLLQKQKNDLILKIHRFLLDKTFKNVTNICMQINRYHFLSTFISEHNLCFEQIKKIDEACHRFVMKSTPDRYSSLSSSYGQSKEEEGAFFSPIPFEDYV